MDISETLAPNSDQLDAVDLLGGPRTFTITKVAKGSTEQPVDITLADFPRLWRPGKSMRRVLASCWGTDASVYVGRRVTLYCDEGVEFGGKAVGGTRISALSHIDKPKHIPLLVSRGRSAMFTVQPLTDAAPSQQSHNWTSSVTTEQPVLGNSTENLTLDDGTLTRSVTTEQPGVERIGTASTLPVPPRHKPLGADVPFDAEGAAVEFTRRIVDEGTVMTREQSAALREAFAAAGLTEQKVRLTYASDVIGRTLTTSADLTKQEASDVIDALEQEAKA